MHTGRRKLLLADDSPTIRKVVSLTFEDEGFEVVTVADGAQALGALEDERPPDVLLADVCMPGLDGYELCERVKRDQRLRGVPVVLLVGTFEPFNEAEARRVGADTVLTKPFQSIRDLVSKVGSLLGGGGSAAESKDEAARDERATDAVPAGVPSRAAQDAEAPHDAHAHSFADFADDELIEARPAESFNATPPEAGPWVGERRRRTDEADAEAFGAAPSDFSAGTSSDFSAPEGARPFVESKDPDFFDSHFTSNDSAAHEPSAFGADDAEELLVLDDEESAAGKSADVLADLTEDDFTAPTRESVMHEQTPAQTSPDANTATAAPAASAVTLDDTLLDLGQLDAPAAAVATSAAEDDDDDFILDLGFDDEPSAAPQPVGAATGADAPSAFAEAAHGERQPAFAGAASSSSASASLAQAERASSVADEGDEAPWRDVVVQDGPRGFVFESDTKDEVLEADTKDEAPLGAVEPEVVPAEETAPAASEDDFSDGSVEGDRPKPPAGQSASSSSFVGAASPSESGAVASSSKSGTAASASGASNVVPQQPSTAGYAVAEGHTRVEEPLRADQLSRGAIETIARRVVELMSDKVVREIAWEVVPELAELLIRQKLEEDRRS